MDNRGRLPRTIWEVKDKETLASNENYVETDRKKNSIPAKKAEQKDI